MAVRKTADDHKGRKLTSMIRKYNRHFWNGNVPNVSLLLAAISVALVMSIPLIYVVYQSLTAGRASWLRLIGTRIPNLLWRTLSLATSVTIGSIVIGVGLAWLITRTDLPGRRIWRWLLAVPLVIPPYIGAVAYINILGPRGMLFRLLARLGSDQLNLSYNVFSFSGTLLVMTLFTYPYVFLITSSAFRKLSQTYEEAGRSMGRGAFYIFLKVNLPLILPAVGAGGVLAFLYVLGDFGAVSMMRYVTFTSAIFFQRVGFDIPSAAVLSLVLIALTVLVLIIEKALRRKKVFYQSSGTARDVRLLRLGWGKYPALFFVGGIFFLSVFLPVVVLIYWTVIAAGQGLINSSFAGYMLNSFTIASFSALFSIILSVPILYLYSRNPSPVSNFIYKSSYTGYALPGVIVALGLVSLFNNHIPVLYHTVFLLIIAQVIRFMPQALQSGEAAINMISPRMDESARSLGYSTWKVIFYVTLPSMMPGLLAGGALVFVNTIRELPATLMLRPPGFETLAIRVYYHASEAMYAQAAPGALLIIIISIIPLHLLLKNY
ncbi:iron ABC transporter permease [Alkalibacterium sp. m-11]|uniref:Iron ABC transporter permease n=1 Tax=Alkalibacterium indicireducens TaxID=398758 RepID=A0ABP3L7C3_9LACT